MDRDLLKEAQQRGEFLYGKPLNEATGNVKNWKAAQFLQALKNEGMDDNPKFGDIKFMKIGNGPKKDGQYLCVAYDDNEDLWLVTWIFAWFKDGEPRADWSGSPTLDGFANKKYANEALKYVATRTTFPTR